MDRVKSIEEFKSIIGKKVINVIEFDDGHLDSGYIILFSDGSRLTAQDGEYGDNAFEFLTQIEFSGKKWGKILGKKVIE